MVAFVTRIWPVYSIQWALGMETIFPADIFGSSVLSCDRTGSSHKPPNRHPTVVWGQPRASSPRPPPLPTARGPCPPPPPGPSRRVHIPPGPGSWDDPVSCDWTREDGLVPVYDCVRWSRCPCPVRVSAVRPRCRRLVPLSAAAVRCHCLALLYDAAVRCPPPVPPSEPGACVRLPDDWALLSTARGADGRPEGGSTQRNLTGGGGSRASRREQTLSRLCQGRLQSRPWPVSTNDTVPVTNINHKNPNKRAEFSDLVFFPKLLGFCGFF